MKRNLNERALIAAAIIGILGLAFSLFTSVAGASATVCQVGNGCTGTTTAPAFGQLLVGNGFGGYSLTATSSLGITNPMAFDYIVSTANGTSAAYKTSTGQTISLSSSTDTVLGAVVSDAGSLGGSIYVKPGTYYLNATSTFAGISDLQGSTWKITGNGMGTTNFVTNNNADAFFFSGTVKFLLSDFTIYVKGGSNGIVSSSTAGYRSNWNSVIENVAITGTTSLSTGFAFNLVDDDHNSYSNVYITNVGNCFRSATDGENKFNPGDATISNIHCSFGAPTNAGGYTPAANTFKTGVAFFFDGSATTSTYVNQDTLINVLAFDPDGTRTAFRFNHASNIRGVSVESEGFATTSEAYNGSNLINMSWEYVTGSSLSTNAYFYFDSSSTNNTNNCSYVDSYAGTQPLFVDNNTDGNNPNILQGINGTTCQLHGYGTFTFSTTSASTIYHVSGGSLGNQYNNILGLSRLYIGTTSPITTLPLEIDGKSDTVYAPGAFNGVRGVLTNFSQVDNTFSNFDFDYYSAFSNTLQAGIRLFGIFNHSNNAADFAIVNGALETLRIRSNGSVGVGTSSPYALLSVSDNTADANTVAFVIASSTAAATTTLFSISNTGAISVAGLNSSILSVNGSGVVVASSSIGTNLLTGVLGTINGTTFNRGGAITITAASSTLLGDNNTFAASTTFSNLVNVNQSSTSFATLGTAWLPNITNALLSTDGSGKIIASTTIGFNFIKGTASSIFAFDASGNATATTSIGTNYITGVLGTINGTSFSRGDSVTIMAASSSLLGDSNVFSGSNVFSQTVSASINGNANTATALQTARTINGVSFNGSSNVVINAASSTLLANNNAFSGSNIFSQPLSLTSTSGSTTITSGQGFTVGSSQFVVQQGSGNVGIGTTNPSNLLHVNGTTRIGLTSGNTGVLKLDSSNGVEWQLTTGGNSNLAVTGNASGAQLLTFTNSSTGSISFGIGTTTPTANFQVTTAAANATTSVQFGKANQTKGTCTTYYDAGGSPVYMYFAAGATSPTYQNGGSTPSGCQN